MSSMYFYIQERPSLGTLFASLLTPMRTVKPKLLQKLLTQISCNPCRGDSYCFEALVLQYCRLLLPLRTFDLKLLQRLK